MRGCDSEALQELLELPDKLSVHRLHQGPEARVPHQGLLRLQLLIDELMKGNAVHRVLQGQLQQDKRRKTEKMMLHNAAGDNFTHTTKKKKKTPKNYRVIVHFSTRFLIASPGVWKNF